MKCHVDIYDFEGDLPILYIVDAKGKDTKYLTVGYDNVKQFLLVSFNGKLYTGKYGEPQ